MNLSRSVLFIALAIFLLISPTYGQLVSREDFPRMSITELFDAGSQDTGWWAMRGMPWPIDELLDRPRGEVIAEAIRRIEQRRVGRYVDVFSVKVLQRLNIENLDEVLIEQYSNLDDLAKYEVLLHAADTFNEGYTQIFVEAVSVVMPESEINNVAVLAAIYQSVAQDEALHEALTNYVSSHPNPEPTVPRTTYLDGFPYSDVIMRSANDVDELFRQTLSIGQYAQSEATVIMSDHEEMRLNEIRRVLLEPDRNDLDIQSQPLIEVLRSLGREFPGFKVNGLSEELRTARVTASVAGRNLSLIDSLAKLCNQLSLSMISSYSVDNTWSISQVNRYGYGATNNCVSVDGFLINIRPSYTDFSNRRRLNLHVGINTTTAWSRYTQTRFRLESLSIENLNSLPSTTAIPIASSLISVPLEDRIPEELGAITVKGKAVLTVPTSFRQIESDLTDEEEFVLEHGYRKFAYTHTPEEVSVEWGSSYNCCSWLQPTLLLDPGNVQLFDEDGNIPDVTKSGSGAWGTRTGARRGFGISERDPWTPGKVVWTYAPTVEIVEIPVVFENMELIPRMTTAQ